MPVLPNARHEKFAQEIVKGTPGTKAYKKAGYKVKSDKVASAAAARMLADVAVAARVEELLGRAAEGAILTRQKLLEELALIGLAPIGDKFVKVADKRAALMDFAKMEGWVVERSENRTTLATISAEPLTPEEWIAKHCTEH